MNRWVARLCFLFLPLVACGLPWPVSAEERLATLDPKASKVTFTLDTTFHEVHGSMALTAGSVRYDPKTGAASGEIEVDARSAVTGNASRDRKMHESILETGRFGRIVFRAERIEGPVGEPGRSEIRVAGTMSLHGADHPMVLPATVTVEGNRLRAELRFEVPYVEWGMADPSFLIVRAQKVVVVTVLAEGTLGAAEASAR